MLIAALMFTGCNAPDEPEWKEGSEVFILDVGSECSEFDLPGPETDGYTGVGGWSYSGTITIYLDGVELAQQSSGGGSYWLDYYTKDLHQIEIRGDSEVPLYFVIQMAKVGAFGVFAERLVIPAGNIDFTYDFSQAVKRADELRPD